MKRFAFSMQYLTDLHDARQQAAEQALGAAQQVLSEVQLQLQTLNAQRGELVAEIEQISGVVRRTAWSEKVRYLQEFDRRIHGCREKLRQAREAVEKCRDELNEEMKQINIMEKLERNERYRWSEELRQAEQKQMDEIAASRWFRREEEV